MRMTVLLALASSTALWGCSGDKDDTAGTDSGETADTGDTETGETADSGDTNETGETGDTGPAVTYSSFVGTTTVTSTVAGQPICDIEADVVGTPYTGDCFDCTFSFYTESTITRDDSTENCSVSPLTSLLPAGQFGDLRVTYWDMLFDEYPSSTYVYFSYGDAYPGPYYYWVGGNPYYYYYGFAAPMNVTFDAGVFTQSYAFDGNLYYYAPSGSSVCAPINWDGSPNTTPGEVFTSSLPCDQPNSYGDLSKYDEITFDVAEGTARLDVTVDSVDAKTAMDTAAYIIGPDECYVAGSDDGWECTYPPAAYGCPAMNVDNPAAGTYRLQVYSWGSCVSGMMGDYQVIVNGASNVVQTVDNGDLPLDIAAVAATMDINLTAQVK